MEPLFLQLKQQAQQAFERRAYAPALDLFRRILDRHPDFADIRHSTGLCLSMLNDPAGALEQFEYALALNPGYVEAHINRALTLQELGRYEEAREAFGRAGYHDERVGGAFPAVVTARLANAHAGVGDLYLAAGSPALAAEEFRRGLELRPQFHDIRNKLAEALLQMGRPAEASEELLRALEGNGRFLTARINLGLAFYRMGLRSQARQEWQIAAQQEPQNPQLRAYLAMLESQERRDRNAD